MKKGRYETLAFLSLLTFFSNFIMLYNSVMSVSSNWVTCGIELQALVNLSAVIFWILLSLANSSFPDFEKVFIKSFELNVCIVSGLSTPSLLFT